jgi:hypothetical protein
MTVQEWIDSLDHQVVFTIYRHEGQEHLFSGVVDAGYVCCIGQGYARTASAEEMKLIELNLESIKKKAKRWSQ